MATKYHTPSNTNLKLVAPDKKENVLIDQRQIQCIAFYKDPKSDTFGNFHQSLIRAGYSPKYAKKQLAKNTKWLLDNIQSDVHLIQKAESNLKKVIEKDIPFTKENIEQYKLKLDASKFIIKNTKYKDTDEKQSAQVQVNIVQYKDNTIDIKSDTL